ncbi:hypothetical protein EJ05DRAFT_144179 [Pseudovirgaria hyperparasitica]|uniref:MFS general substrate transporter n=1 Tax=Pseudovirgaria hyperparasitica TaxID=470096 RepID=A0A6A6VXG9_9PEZI|nr:uncharacterized protein EJ05DRAFT_144179 [Pseudovirgaria hyperparasitica]KAF2754529.1 hypothetical protein EJ05DRAFT_144179 [Pseudovirgaria hyperparasitica]
MADDCRHSNLALALAMLHDASRLGGATTSLATPRLLVHSVPFATNILTLVSTIPLILSCASLSIVISPSSRSPSNLVTPLTNSLRTPNLIQTGIITSILSLPTRFWAFAHVSVTLYAAIAGFHVVAQRHVAATFYDGSDVAAGTALSVMPLLSVLFVPFFGHLLSKPWASVPRAAMLSCACLLLGHTLMIVRALGAVVPLVMLGFGGAGFGAVFGLGIAQSVGRGSKKVVDMNGGAYSRVLDHDDDVGAAEYVDVSADANLHADDDLRDSVSSSMLMSTLSTSTATHEPEDRISSSDANNIVTVAFGAGVGLLNASGALVPLLVAPLEASTDHTAVGSFAAVQIFLAGIAGMACVLCVRLERVWGRA